MNTDGLRGELSLNEPLARHTSWRIGGPGRCFYRPADAADLSEFLRRLKPQEPLLWLGLGSNLLVADAGFPGTVLETQGCLTTLQAVGKLGVRTEAAVACAKVARFAARRAQTQPTGLPSCGSVFRNPPGDYAARLIEAAGLKGVAIGGAQVSKKHANFIINTGSASGTDIARFIEHVRDRVETSFGVRLVTEVKRVGGEAA